MDAKLSPVEAAAVAYVAARDAWFEAFHAAARMPSPGRVAAYIDVDATLLVLVESVRALNAGKAGLDG